MKLILRLFNFLFVLCVLALIFHNFTAKLLLSSVLRWSLGAPVEIEDAKVDFLNTQVNYYGVVIKNPSGFPEGTLARIPHLFIDLETSSLWEGKLHCDSVEADIQDLRVVRIGDGRLNLLALKVFRPNSSAGNEKIIDRDETPRFRIEHFEFNLARATYTDISSDRPKQQSFNLDIEHRAYRDLSNLGDVAEIITSEAMGRMKLNPVLNQAITQHGFYFSSQNRNVIEKTVSAVKNL